MLIPFMLLSCVSHHQVYQEPLRVVVAVPVVNVRSEPTPHSMEYKYDPLQETQLEKGEPVLVYERQGDWVRIEAPEQLEFTHHQKWEGYPGWVRWDALIPDLEQHHRLTRSQKSQEMLREEILKQAARHEGTPYLWGGRSLHDPANSDTVTGVDCSGLVNWSFRQVGWFIPRDAHEQFMRARRIDPKDLKKGDLIFLANVEKPDKIVHVAFYAGGDKILEAPSSGKDVREISSVERFGKPLLDMSNGEKVEDRIIYFGSFFMKD